MTTLFGMVMGNPGLRDAFESARTPGHADAAGRDVSPTEHLGDAVSFGEYLIWLATRDRPAGDMLHDNGVHHPPPLVDGIWTPTAATATTAGTGTAATRKPTPTPRGLNRDRDDDSRAVLNELWQQYLRAVRQVRPLAFVIENVPEFQRSAQFARLLALMETDPVLSEYGYNYGVLNAAYYGAPQRRRRGIFIAVRGVDQVPWPPERTHGPHSADGQPYITVRDAIAELPLYPETTEIAVDDGHQDLHFGRSPRPCSK